MAVSTPTPELDRCRTCGRVIRWVQTAAGSWQPVDRDPNPRGNVYLDAEGRSHSVRAGSGPHDVAALYMPHFATCDGRGASARDTERARRRTEERLQRSLLGEEPDETYGLTPELRAEFELLKQAVLRFGRRLVGGKPR